MTDGASITKNLEKILEIDQQLCFAHALQLTVISVLYKKDASHLEVDESLDENTVFANLDNNDEDDDYNSEYAYEEEDYIRDSNNQLLINETSEVTIKHQIIGPIITKVKKIVKMFKRFPTKNENYLQKYVKFELWKGNSFNYGLQNPLEQLVV